MRKIITYRWHAGHQYDLWKLPFQFSLMTGLTRVTAVWDYKSRPLPSNAEFLSHGHPTDLTKFDGALLHFDEFVLHPELANGSVSPDWGNQFKFLMENFKGPKVAICHGVPVYKGDTTPNGHAPDRGEIIDSYRQELVDYLGDTLVICNSHQAQKEWGFKNSRVIWHGFDPLLHPPSDGTGGILTVSGQIKNRPYYRGLDVYEAVMAKIGWKAHFVGDDLPNAVKIPFPPEAAFATKNEWGMANYLSYVHFLRRYGVFFNPTMRSPMPRVRGEAMMSGLAMVTTDSHDASLFIEHGHNGFVTSDPDELASILLELLRNPGLRSTVGKRSRDTALELFHVNRFLQDWQDVVRSLGLVSKTFHLGDRYPVVKQPTRSVDEAQRYPGILYVGGSGGGTDRYRVQFPVEAVADSGMNVAGVHISSASAVDLQAMLRSGLYHALICHRVGMSETLRRIVDTAKANNVLPIYDVDDLVFVLEFGARLARQGHRTPEQAPREVEAYRGALSLFSHATCTTNLLKVRLQELGVSNIEIVPNTFSKKLKVMSDASYVSRKKNKEARKHIVIGYPSGSATHDKDLEVAATGLRRLLSEFSHVELRLVGDVKVPEQLKGFGSRITQHPFVHWLLLPNVLADFDICIAPLENDEFCNAKSNLKYFEAGLVRVPTVASATEPLQASIQNGINGFIAADDVEWYEHLRLLVTNAQLRRDIGSRAYEDVIHRYSPEVRVARTVGSLSKWLSEAASVAAPSVAQAPQDLATAPPGRLQLANETGGTS